MKNSKIIFLAAAVLIIVISIFFIKKSDSSKNDNIPPKEQPVLSSQTNAEGMVEVTVTPKDLSPSSPSWDFDVILTNHSGSLDQDLTKSAVLIDDKGNKFVPTAWEGDPPGGHHRSGVLKFMPITIKPQFVKLEISGGDTGKKIFKWVLQ